MDEKQSHCLSFFDLWCILVLLPLCGELRCGYLSCASELSTNQHSTYAYCHGHQAAKCVVAFLENSRDSLNGLKSLSLRGHRATQTQTRDRGLTPQALQFFELLLTDHPSCAFTSRFLQHREVDRKKLHTSSKLIYTLPNLPQVFWIISLPIDEVIRSYLAFLSMVFYYRFLLKF